MRDVPKPVAPTWLRRAAGLLVRGPQALDVRRDLDDLFVRDVERGLPRSVAARRFARNLLGSSLTVTRDRLRRPSLRSFSLLDLKLGVRMLIKYPGLTAVGGLAMAFAIATGATGFEFYRQMVSPVLPLEEGGRLVGIRVRDRVSTGIERQALHDFLDWRREAQTIDDISAFRTLQRNFTTVEEAFGEPLDIAEMSASGFRVARVAPLLGRTLLEADEQPGGPQVVVLGYEVWQTRLGADPDVVGETVRVGNTPHTVVGVMPEGFRFPLSHAAWVPFRVEARDHERGHGPGIDVFGRLAAGAGRSEAQVELSALGERTAAEFPDTHGNLHPEVVAYARAVMNVDMEYLIGLTSINAFLVMLLVLVCGNVSLLMFARAATRESELLVRSALGASRGRIVGQLFAEALVLGALAAAVGLTASGSLLRWWMSVYVIESAGRIPFWFSGTVGTSTYLYAAALTVLAALIAGVGPALKATRRDADARLRQSAAGGGGMRFSGVWTVVIVAQVAVTVAFPVTAFVARQMVIGVQTMDVGFESEEYLSARLAIDEQEAQTADGAAADAAQAALRTRFRASLRALEERLAAEPGVAGTTLTSHLPRTLHLRGRVEIDAGESLPDSTEGTRVSVAAVALNFFDMLGAPILAGRGFRSDDLETGRRPVIVNQSFVDSMLGGAEPIGSRLRYVNRSNPRAPRRSGDQPGEWHEIVGVVRDLGTMGDSSLAGFYHPRAADAAFPVYLAVHAPPNAETLAPRLRQIAAEIDPTLRLHEMLPLDEVGQNMWREMDFMWRLLILVSGVALLLSTAGIYSVTSFAVSRRTREIGVRVALGADSRRIVTSIFRRPLIQVGAGIAAGGILANALVLSASGGTISAAGVAGAVAYALVMIGVCALACVVPTRRALRIEPTQALRHE